MTASDAEQPFATFCLSDSFADFAANRILNSKDRSQPEADLQNRTLQRQLSEQIHSFAFTTGMPATGPAKHFQLRVQSNKFKAVS